MKIDKNALASKINDLDGLSNAEKSALLELLNTQKKYGLVWEDKPEKVEQELATQIPVLTEVKDKAILCNHEDAPNHILIEGDNLHALTALQYTHAGKIDVIYIDPPYNTGNKDFIYNDTFVDKEDSYRHSKWLSFMSKRIKLAKTLLKETGVIFISIDDNEQAQLKLLCDEIINNSNYVGNVIWQSRTSISNDDHISTNHNHTHIYAKNICKMKFGGDEIDVSEYSNPDNDPRGPWKLVPIDANKAGGNTVYGITNPYTSQVYFPPGKRIWAINEDTYKALFNDNRIKFGINNNSAPKRKLFLYERQAKGDVKTASSLLLKQNGVPTTKDGTNEVIEILGEKKFDYPKPTGLVSMLLKYSTFEQNIKGRIILDFFAGSGTTLHATMALNAEDGGNRQCILVTNNENNICEEVTYERNKRVIQGYTNAKGVEVEGLTQNTLRYFKTEYVKREPNLKNKKALVRAAIDLLCIKEDCYQLHAEISSDDLKVYEKSDLVMIVCQSEEAIEESLAVIRNTSKPCKVYVFAPAAYPHTAEFEEELEPEDFARIQLCALPDAIYRAYQSVLAEADRKNQFTDKNLDIAEEGEV